MLIENELYDKIREVLPTVCVDLLVTNEQKEYLLANRTEKPAKGSWWFPGGRIRKGETWQECAKRKGREELGIDLPIGNLIPHPHMSEHERAEMFYHECLEQMGIENPPPLPKEESK